MTNACRQRRLPLQAQRAAVRGATGASMGARWAQGIRKTIPVIAASAVQASRLPQHALRQVGGFGNDGNASMAATPAFGGVD